MTSGELLSGYGWVFPLGEAAGEVNIGVGTLATARRPAGVQLKALLETYTDARRDEWQIEGPVRAPASALLPMGGAVSGVAGRNWALIGDAAGCVNPLNGEGIDYGLETGRSVVSCSARTTGRRRGRRPCAGTTARRSPSPAGWPGCSPCRGSCRRPVRSACARGALMTVALRVMGNLVTDDDRDVVARGWRLAGRLSVRLDDRPPFPATDLRSA